MSVYDNDNETEEERIARLQRLYEEVTTPEERAATKEFFDEWFASIWPEDLGNASPPPSADIIDINTRKKPQ